MPKKNLFNINELIVDLDIYPREKISSFNLKSIREAFEQDIPLPPIVACDQTKKVIDGVHRRQALIDLHGADAKWEVKFERFGSDKERLLRSMQLNATHGLKLSRYDISRCVVIGEKLKLTASEIAAGIGVSEKHITEITKARFEAKSGSRLGDYVPPLKRSIKHMAGKKLTEKQRQTNEKLSGWSVNFHAQQIMETIDANLVNTADENTMAVLAELREKLTNFLEQVEAVA